MRQKVTRIRSGYTPFTDNSWRIGCSNAESRELEFACATGDIRVLVSTVGGRCLRDLLIGNIEKGYRRGDAAQVVPINQVRIAIFAQCDHEMGRRCAWHVHK